MADQPEGPTMSLTKRLKNRLAAIHKNKQLMHQRLKAAHASSQGSIIALQGVSPDVVTSGVQFADMYLATLRSYIRAQGGELEITATYPEGRVKIEKLSQ